MDEVEPLSDEVLAELMQRHVWDGQDYTDLERDLAAAYATMRQLIAEVRRLRAERVRWEVASEVLAAARRCVDPERVVYIGDDSWGDAYPHSDDFMELGAAIRAYDTPTTPAAQQAAGPEQGGKA